MSYSFQYIQSLFINPIKLTLAILLLAVMSLACFNAGAQSTNTPPPPPATPSSPAAFYQEAFAWFTSFNSSNTWIGTTFELGVAADYENGVQWASKLEPQWDVNGGNWIIGDAMRNAGIGGTIESDEAVVGYAILTEFDLRAEGKLGVGYSLEYRAAMIEPEIDIRKLIATYTFLGLYISEPFYVEKNLGSNQYIPNIGVETGFIGGNGPITTTSAHARWAHHFYAFKKFISPRD